MFSWKPLAGALALASTLCFPSHAQNDTVQQMQALVLANQHNRAFELGEQHIEEAGLPGFDFYYGIAAIEAGSPSAGVFALERYITAYPDNRTARFYLARGFFILGEDQLARAEFEDLLNNANDAENAVIQQYLDAIWERENRHYPRLRLVAEVGLGHDSNVNEGVAVGPVAGLLFPLSVSQNDSNRQVGDTVALSNIGIEGSRPIAPGLTWQGHAKAGLYAPSTEPSSTSATWLPAPPWPGSKAAIGGAPAWPTAPTGPTDSTCWTPPAGMPTGTTGKTSSTVGGPPSPGPGSITAMSTSSTPSTARDPASPAATTSATATCGSSAPTTRATTATPGRRPGKTPCSWVRNATAKRGPTCPAISGACNPAGPRGLPTAG